MCQSRGCALHWLYFTKGLKHMSQNTVRAAREFLDLGKIKLDAYQLPDGEVRVGIAGVSQSLGHSKEWFGRLRKEGVKRWNALLTTGFTGCEKEVSVAERGAGQRGASIAKTISVRDFTKVIDYEARHEKNMKAVALALAFMETGVEKALHDLFAGNQTDYILARIIHYSEWSYEDYMEALQYNWDDAKELYS